MADPRHQLGSGAPGEFGQHRIARVAFGAAHLHLDEFVVTERPPGFGDDGVGEAMLANQDDGLERVGATAQETQLVFS